MKPLLSVVGVIAIAFGLFWAAQGAGFVTWPSGSFMVNNGRVDLLRTRNGVGGAVLVSLAGR